MLIIWSSSKAAIIKEALSLVLSTDLTPHVIHSSFEPPEVNDGDVVLACGGKALEVLQNIGLVPKNRTISSMRETPIAVANHAGAGRVLITYDPAIIKKDYSKLPEIQWDCQLACRLHNTGSTQPMLGDYKYMDSLHEIIERVDMLYNKIGNAVPIAVDLETLGLDEYNPDAWIISISVTIEEGYSQVVYFTQDERPAPAPDGLPSEEMNYWELLWRQLDWLLTTDMVSTRGANFKFDSRWLVQKWGIYCTNFKMDTLLVGSLLDENRSNSLKLHAKVFTALGGYDSPTKKYDFARVDLIPKDELLPYAGGDTDATLRVSNVFRKQLINQPKLANFYINVLHPSAQVFEKVERNGIVVDTNYYAELQNELSIEKTKLEKIMVGMLPATLANKHADKIEECFAEGKNPMGTKILKDFLFTQEGLGLEPMMVTEKTKEPSTALDHLMMFEDNPVAKQFIDSFKDYGSVTKTLSTYVIGFLKHLRSDGRFHPSYMLFRGAYGGDDDDSGTVTGRSSAKDPAIQTIPKHTKWAKRLRRAIIAPQGMTILQADYAQGELKIAACVANEPTMIEAYRKGIDLHAVTAAGLNGYELDEFMALPEDIRDALRSSGKAGNFGLLYGMGANGFRVYAKTSYGVEMTETEAGQKRDAFFALYSKLPLWHENSRQTARDTLQIVSPLGRIRHLPLIHSTDNETRAGAERQSINSPIQATLSDLMQLAMVGIDKQYGQKDIQMFMMTHDSVAMYVPIEIGRAHV